MAKTRNPVLRNMRPRLGTIEDGRPRERLRQARAHMDEDTDYPCVRCSALVHWRGALCARCLEDEPE